MIDRSMRSDLKHNRKEILICAATVLVAVILYPALMYLLAFFMWAYSEASHTPYSGNLVHGYMFAMSAFYMGYLISQCVTRKYEKLVNAGIGLLLLVLIFVFSWGSSLRLILSINYEFMRVILTPAFLALSAALGAAYGFSRKIRLHEVIATLAGLYLLYQLAAIYMDASGLVHLFWLAAVAAYLGIVDRRSILRWAFFFAALFGVNHFGASFLPFFGDSLTSDPKAYALPGQKMAEFDFGIPRSEIADPEFALFAIAVFAAIFVFTAMFGFFGAFLAQSFSSERIANKADESG